MHTVIQKTPVKTTIPTDKPLLAMDHQRGKTQQKYTRTMKHMWSKEMIEVNHRSVSKGQVPYIKITAPDKGLIRIF